MSARLLTLADVADRLAVSVRTVRRLIHERRLTAVKIGRSLRVEESAVSELLQVARVPALRVVEPAPAVADNDHLDELVRKHGLG